MTSRKEELKQILKDLIKEKEELENFVREKQKEVQVFKDKGLDKDLIDEEGFPREDLVFEELKEYRLLKRTINEKTNDYKDLMKKIEHQQELYFEEI